MIVRSFLAILLLAPATIRQDAFTLDSTTYKGGDKITLKFPAALQPAEGTQYWCCIVPVGTADSSFGSWTYVKAGATSAELTAPATSGDYEVRLHSDYPKKSYNVVHRIKVTVGGLSPTKPEDMKFTLESESIPVDKQIKVKFAAPMVPLQNESFWLALVEAGAPDDERGLWVGVAVGATEAVLPAATASGKHEVRLHANYPTKRNHIVHRVALDVTGGPDTAPSDPAKIEPKLAKDSIGIDEAPAVQFALPVRPRTGERFWVSLVAAGLPDTAQGVWGYVTPGTKSTTIPKATSTGEHEVRVHANYPKKSTNIVARLKLTVTGGDEFAPTDPAKVAIKPAAPKCAVGEAPKVRFTPALRARTGEMYWVTLIEADKPDGDWGQFKHLAVGATEETLPAPKKAGKYEIRLHANYPTKPSNVVQRVALIVE